MAKNKEDDEEEEEEGTGVKEEKGVNKGYSSAHPWQRRLLEVRLP